MSDLPGEEFAKEHGYELQSHSGNRLQATYLKRLDGVPPIYLTCYSDGTATLQRILGLITCESGKFSIPGNFVIFEKQISQLYIGEPTL